VSRYDTLRRGLNDLRSTILLKGPMTLYDAENELQVSSTNIKRHIEILVREKELVVYRTELHWSRQTKKFYGLTLYGFLRSFRIPGKVAKKNFEAVMTIWLRQERFNFFLPKAEVINVLNHREAEVHLARLCQMIAETFPEAEDLADFLESQGFDESDPTQIIQLAMRLAPNRYGDKFVATSKILCKHLPTYREQLQRSIQSQLSRLQNLEKELGFA
jgi:hypothetical protein